MTCRLILNIRKAAGKSLDDWKLHASAVDWSVARSINVINVDELITPTVPSFQRSPSFLALAAQVREG